MNILLLPLWIAGLYRIFRHLNNVDYSFLGLLFVVTFVLMFVLHNPACMLAELFVPLLASSAVYMEEIFADMHWEKGMKAGTAAYLLVVGVIAVPLCLPILPMDLTANFARAFKPLLLPVKESNGLTLFNSPLLSGRLWWDELVQDVAGVYNRLYRK